MVENLDLMFERATTAPAPATDQLAIETLAALVTANPALVQRLVQKIADGLHSTNSVVQRRTIEVLDTCMHSAPDEFRLLIGKFRFLNEIVKLLSPTRALRPPAPHVRQRLMDLMLVWTAQYPHIPKIREAYDMLRKQGVVHSPPSDHSVVERVHAQRPRGHERTVFDAIPKELLLSRDPADVQTAKLLIEQALEREQREQAMRAAHRNEVRLGREVAEVLDEMLTVAGEGTVGDGGDEDGREVMRELFEQCRSLQISVAAFAAGGDGEATLGGANDESSIRTEMNELLQANDAMQSVIQRYTTLVLERPSDPEVQPPKPDTLPTSNQAISNTDLLTAIMSDAPLSEGILALTALPAAASDVLGPQTTPKPTDELGTLDAIFTARPTSSDQQANNAGRANPDIVTDALLLADATPPSAVGVVSDLLAPIIPTAGTTTKTTDPEAENSKSKRSDEKTTKPVSELDMFGLESVITGLKNNLASQADKSTAEASTVVEVPVQISAPESTTPIANVDTGDTDDDDILLQPAAAVSPQTPLAAADIVPILPLADIHIDLATIQPSPMPARIILDDRAGLKIVLHFALDRPRPDCSVYVLTITNQSAQPVRSLSIDASVSKPCKVRLLPASGSALPACKPFRPPTEDVTQLLLVANASGQPTTDMWCMVSYNLGDDPDATKESIGVPGLPAMN